MLEKLLQNLQSLHGTAIEIRGEGNYPNISKRRSRRAGLGTRVQEVAVYQNDGTATITASHFVERSAAQHRGWATPIFAAVSKYLDLGLKWELDQVGLEIAKDINDAVDRIRTGRLKKSFRPKVTQ